MRGYDDSAALDLIYEDRDSEEPRGAAWGSVWSFASWAQVDHKMSEIHPEDWGGDPLKCEAGHDLTRGNIYYWGGEQLCGECRRGEVSRSGNRTGRHWAPGVYVSECINGHPYTPDNTQWYMKANGRRYRQCKTCHQVRNRARRAERRKVA